MNYSVENHVVAIMAGGIGSRFWPKSRTAMPKQFLDILNTGQTLIQNTFTRFNGYIDAKNIYVITSLEYKDLVAAQLPGLPIENILCEPARKNTAPCIAYITYKMFAQNPNITITCAPADHFVNDELAFKETHLKAVSFAESINSIVTIGITPTYPNTGYGYIQRKDIECAPGIFPVKLFAEKPNKELAQTFFESGDFLWNAGIFTFKAQHMVTAYETLLPELHDVFYAELSRFNTQEEKTSIDSIYPLCTNVSVDIGIMEKSKNVYLIPASFGWSDLGTWASAYENLEKDYYDNAVVGENVMIFDARQNIIQAPNKKLVLIEGLEDYIVVDTNDVLLICNKNKEQEIKNYVAEVKRSSGEKFL
jgi:mannose-1-phosphate guanylyltransferase